MNIISRLDHPIVTGTVAIACIYTLSKTLPLIFERLFKRATATHTATTRSPINYEVYLVERSNERKNSKFLSRFRNLNQAKNYANYWNSTRRIVGLFLMTFVASALLLKLANRNIQLQTPWPKKRDLPPIAAFFRTGPALIKNPMQ